MIRAIIFDFDGVLADTEPLHLRAFVDLLAPLGITVSREDYFTKYVGLTDPAFLRRIFADYRRPLNDDGLAGLLDRKNEMYMSMIAGGIDLPPGVAEFVTREAKRRPLAICSGARRVEIETILSAAGLLSRFSVIVTSDDVPTSKPDPAGFLRALDLLRRPGSGPRPRAAAVADRPGPRPRAAADADRPGPRPHAQGSVGPPWPTGRDASPQPRPAEGERSSARAAAAPPPSLDLNAADCLAVEDSPNGVAAAKAAGLRVLAVQSQCTAAQLAAADLVVPDLRAVSDAELASI